MLQLKHLFQWRLISILVDTYKPYIICYVYMSKWADVQRLMQVSACILSAQLIQLNIIKTYFKFELRYQHVYCNLHFKYLPFNYFCNYALYGNLIWIFYIIIIVSIVVETLGDAAPLVVVIYTIHLNVLLIHGVTEVSGSDDTQDILNKIYKFDEQFFFTVFYGKVNVLKNIFITHFKHFKEKFKSIKQMYGKNELQNTIYKTFGNTIILYLIW